MRRWWQGMGMRLLRYAAASVVDAKDRRCVAEKCLQYGIVGFERLEGGLLACIRVGCAAAMLRQQRRHPLTSGFVRLAKCASCGSEQYVRLRQQL